MPFERYCGGVLEPLALAGELRVTGIGYLGPLDDLLKLGRECSSRPDRRRDDGRGDLGAIPGLVGVLPGWGRMDPNDWGLGFELRDHKQPHWTGRGNSPRTFGHFGATGTFLWVDPDAGLACGALTDRDFGDWAKEAWPRFSDAVLAEAAAA